MELNSSMTGCIVGTPRSINKISQNMSNYSLEDSMKPLGDKEKRRTSIDYATMAIYDHAATSSDKITEMDQKLDKICKHFDIQA